MITAKLCILLIMILSNDDKIIKVYSFYTNIKGFDTEGYLKQVRYYRNDTLYVRKDILSNNYQDSDSIVYQYSKNCTLKTIYVPIYIGSFKKDYRLLNYKLAFIDSIKKSDTLYVKSKDKYSLSSYYLDNINWLMSLAPIYKNGYYTFKRGVCPIIMSEYSVVFNSLLLKFKFKIFNNLLVEDEFIYQKFKIIRKYIYIDDTLRLVKIHFFDNKGKFYQEYVEYYEI